MSINAGSGFPVPPIAAVDPDVIDERDVDPALRDREAEQDLDADRGESDRATAADEPSEAEPRIAVAPEQRD